MDYIHKNISPHFFSYVHTFLGNWYFISGGNIWPSLYFLHWVILHIRHLELLCSTLWTNSFLRIRRWTPMKFQYFCAIFWSEKRNWSLAQYFCKTIPIPVQAQNFLSRIGIIFDWMIMLRIFVFRNIWKEFFWTVDSLLSCMRFRDWILIM